MMINSSAPVSISRGLSKDQLECLTPSGSKHKVVYRRQQQQQHVGVGGLISSSADIRDLILCNVQTSLSLVEVDEENPEVIVKRYQEKLRENSKSRVAVDVTAKPNTDGRVASASSAANIDSSAKFLLGYISEESPSATPAKPSPAESSFFLENYLNPPNFDMTTGGALMPIALDDAIDQFLGEIIFPLKSTYYSTVSEEAALDVSRDDNKETSSSASSLLPNSDLFKAVEARAGSGEGGASGGNNSNNNKNGGSSKSGSSNNSNAALSVKDVSDADSLELLKDEMRWVKEQMELKFDARGDGNSPRSTNKQKKHGTNDNSLATSTSTQLSSSSTSSSADEKKENEGVNGSVGNDDININSIADALVLSDIESSINKKLRDKKGINDSSSRITWATTDTLDVSEFESLRPKLAMQYPFELDFFQKQAVMRLERRECIFVAAHTSAGKTVVAEYAIALAKRHMTRAVYTSPIKALSNQKYRDFREKFDPSEVGLITGDISINPEACCLIMTTEILRSMLYRGADTVKDIEWVIFDEVHYVNDAERGVVWEEVIIMLPEKINLIFLSATTPNTVEFCDWIGRTKRRNVYVIATNKRPVPLQHFMFHDDDMYQVMSAETGYTPAGLSAATKKQKDKLKPKEKSAENVKLANDREMEKLAVAAQNAGKTVEALQASMKDKKEPPKAKTAAVVKGSNDPSGSKQQWLSLVHILRDGGRLESGGQADVDFGLGHLPSMQARADRKAQMVRYEKLPEQIRAVMSKREYEAQEFRGDEEESDTKEGLLPVVIFCFSKKKCEVICDYLSGQDFLKAKEKAAVGAIMAEAKSRLNPLDINLPQIERVEDMLMRGVGVHHSGLLPILKECVEILFSKSIVRVLVATETFAMGVNMPARAVVFNGCRKHDGKNFRPLLPGEYTQMAGRAGRRGLDKVGTVIMAEWDELPSEMDLKTLLTGTATKLTSQFRLSYGMILNLLRVNDLKVEDMIKRSFSEFHAQKALTNHDLASRSLHYQMIQEKLSAERLLEESETEAGTLDRYVTSVSRARRSHQQMTDYILTSSKMDLNLCLSTGRLVCLHQSNLLSPAMAIIIKQYVPPKQAPSLGIGRMLSSASPLDTSSSATASGGGGGVGGVISPKVDRIYWVIGLVGRTGKVPIVDKAESSTGGGGRSINFGGPNKSDNKDKEIDINSFEFKEDSGYFDADAKTSTSITAGSSQSDSFGYFIDKVSASSIVFVTNKTIKLSMPKNISKLPKEQQQPAFINAAMLQLIEANNAILSDRSPDLSSNILKYTKEFKINDFDFGVIQSTQVRAVTEMLSSPVHFDDLSSRKFNRAYKIKMIDDKMSLISSISSNESLSHFPDFMQRLSLLKVLNYVDMESDTPNIKGRIACEINTSDELIVTEIIFNNIFEPLNPPEAAGILSALVFQEKTESDCLLTSRMEMARSQVVDIYDAINELQDQEGVIFDAETKPRLNFGLSSVVYEWARGMSFKDITQMTNVHEGSIVRCISRLDELIKDVRNAARVIGNPSLYRKMEAASQCIKRDIVFAASLYIT